MSDGEQCPSYRGTGESAAPRPAASGCSFQSHEQNRVPPNNLLIVVSLFHLAFYGHLLMECFLFCCLRIGFQDQMNGLCGSYARMNKLT